METVWKYHFDVEKDWSDQMGKQEVHGVQARDFPILFLGYWVLYRRSLGGGGESLSPPPPFS